MPSWGHMLPGGHGMESIFSRLQKKPIGQTLIYVNGFAEPKCTPLFETETFTFHNLEEFEYIRCNALCGAGRRWIGSGCRNDKYS